MPDIVTIKFDRETLDSLIDLLNKSNIRKPSDENAATSYWWRLEFAVREYVPGEGVLEVTQHIDHPLILNGYRGPIIAASKGTEVPS